jgi:hypothetical protein
VSIAGGKATLGGEISSNMAQYGGGLSISSENGALSNLHIVGNAATSGNPYGGGGVSLKGGSLVLSDTQVLSNSANWAGIGTYVFTGSVTLMAVSGRELGHLTGC